MKSTLQNGTANHHSPKRGLTRDPTDRPLFKGRTLLAQATIYMLGHSQASLNKCDLSSVLPSTHLSLYQILCAALRPALSSLLQCQACPKYRVIMSRRAPAPAATGFLQLRERPSGAGHPCARDGLIANVSEGVKSSNHKSLKYWKRYPLCPSN